MTAIVAVPGSEAGCCIATVPLSAAVALIIAGRPGFVTV
jgi:hypothetical protein